MRNIRQSVRRGEVLLGTFIKTPSHVVTEILGEAGLDFAILDCEHAAFDPETLDRMALASKAADLPCLVRVAEASAPSIGQTLDLGFAGVLVPHAKSAEISRAALAASKYEWGERGFSPSTRAGHYGTRDAAAYRAAADRDSSVWCQIEDSEALPRLDEIAAVDEVDCLFIGRADLALSLKAQGPGDPRVKEAVAAIAAAGRRHGRTVGIFIGDTAEVPELLDLGITVFVCGSDQSFLLAQGRRARKELGDVLAVRPAP